MLIQAATSNGVTQHATQEQLDCLKALRDCVISNQSPYKNPSGLSSQGLSEGQLSEAAQYYSNSLERMLRASRDILLEVCLSPLTGNHMLHHAYGCA